MEQYFTAMFDEVGHDAVASHESAFMASGQTTDVTLGQPVFPCAYGPIPAGVLTYFDCPSREGICCCYLVSF